MPGVKPKLTNCPKCNLDWIGQEKCDCGWRPNQHLVVVKIVVAIAVVAGLGAAGFLAQHYNEYFPNETAAQEHIVKADDLFGQGSFAPAVEQYQVAANYSPKRADIRKKLALALLNDNRPHEAGEEMAIACKLAPHDIEMRKAYAITLEQRGDDEQAAEVLTALINDDPKQSDLKFHLGEIYSKMGNNAKAKELFAEFIKVKPKANGPWLSLARLQENDGEHKEAIATLRKGLQFLPQDAPIYQQLGISLGEDGQKAEAVKALLKASEIDPNCAEFNSHIIAEINKGNTKGDLIIPLKKTGTSYMVDVMLNETTPVRMLVDSGADSVAISTDIAKKLKLVPEDGKPILVQSATGIAFTRKFVLPSVRVGRAKELLVPCTVIPHGPMDGLLGMSFLKRYEFTIDARRNVLVLKQR